MAAARLSLKGSRILLSKRICLPIPVQQRRTFFGVGEIMGVIANPAETLRQLKESKDLLVKAREEAELSREAQKIPKKHTFAKLPGFHGREAEQELLRKILSNTPKLNVIFGATSVGKTALLRQVLATDDFYTITFDLRISGFADLRTLYLALCEQFETFFQEMEDEEMDKQRLVFKHLALGLLEKEKDASDAAPYQVSVADIASLMESLQSCLLRYWEYDPAPKKEDGDGDGEAQEVVKDDKPQMRTIDATETSEEPKITTNKDGEEVEEKVFKKKPIVFFMDEAHKLPALVDDQLSLKVFLDTLLVLTKQDRLCHVIFSTSDSFFHHFLRSMNVGHHTQILTVGDCTKAETESYFNEVLLDTIPDSLKAKVDFEEIYHAFGGKLSHVSDYLAAWVNSEGTLTPYTSAIFTQAYTLLQFHLTHANFETFSPLSAATAGNSTEEDAARFTSEDLLYVMRKLTKSPYSMPYFTLCRQLGTDQIDSMIKARLLDLRWTKTVSPEMEGWAERVWSEDGIERPVVLPMTRIVRRAMEIVLKEEEEITKRLELEGEEQQQGGKQGDAKVKAETKARD